MAGGGGGGGGSSRHHSALGNPRRIRSPFLLFILALLFLPVLFYVFSLSSSSSSSSSSFSSRSPILLNPNVDYSFVSSLAKFLSNKPSPSLPDDTALAYSPTDLRQFDDRVRTQESLYLLHPHSFSTSPIRVYAYDMPAKFTYDMLWLFHNTYRDTFNLTSNGSPVHRLIEQHSVDYWLWSDLIAPESQRLLKTVVRVHRQEEADLFYIPFFTTISFFLLEKPQCKSLYREALKWVTDQPAWKRSEGRDHILPVHHPWSFKSVRRYMKNAVWLLPDMDSTGNWYKPGQVSLEKDLILPYVPNLDFCDANCLSESKSKRNTLLYFRGRLKRNAVRLVTTTYQVIDDGLIMLIFL